MPLKDEKGGMRISIKRRKRKRKLVWSKFEKKEEERQRKKEKEEEERQRKKEIEEKRKRQNNNNNRRFCKYLDLESSPQKIRVSLSGSSFWRKKVCLSWILCYITATVKKFTVILVYIVTNPQLLCLNCHCKKVFLLILNVDWNCIKVFKDPIFDPSI